MKKLNHRWKNPDDETEILNHWGQRRVSEKIDEIVGWVNEHSEAIEKLERDQRMSRVDEVLQHFKDSPPPPSDVSEMP